VQFMSLVKWIFIGLLGLPAAELICFLVVAAVVGWLWAAILLITTSALGVVLLKQSGRRDLARLADRLRSDGLAGLQLRSPEVANTLGAALLVVPGFLTDVLGAALLVPIGRQWVAGVLAKAAARPERGAGVIELAPGEWHHVADPEPPRRRAERQEP
jgi:UPF0716 protein FxsA